jgi:hypothetical protein
MNKNANPLDHIIQCCEDATNTGKWKLTKFDILNARDELKKLRQKLADSYQELFNCNQDFIEEINKVLNYEVVGWARINDRGDIYDLRMCHNPYVDEKTVIPLYCDKKSFEKWKDDNKSK